MESEKITMTANKQEDIVLYSPTRSWYPVAFTLVCLYLIGVQPLLLRGSLRDVVIDLFFAICAVWLGPVMLWRQFRHPKLLLVITTEGMESHLARRQAQLFRWEEIGHIYRTRVQKQWALAVDLSPSGKLAFTMQTRKRLARGQDLTTPEQVLLIASSRLPIPVGELLNWIREQFSEQLECYQIDFQG